jgi:hypothetical protein
VAIGENDFESDKQVRAVDDYEDLVSHARPVADDNPLLIRSLNARLREHTCQTQLQAPISGSLKKPKWTNRGDSVQVIFVDVWSCSGRFVFSKT